MVLKDPGELFLGKRKKRSDKSAGGQEGHEGTTLEKVDSPDEIIEQTDS